VERKFLALFGRVRPTSIVLVHVIRRHGRETIQNYINYRIVIAMNVAGNIILKIKNMESGSALKPVS